ncbi:penicillin-binding protein [Bacteroides sp. 519]|uniref:penicillin-binding protein n=1 Tax=Bacteroides sp. 519 TaxID=2302937 RepID=UPI001EF2285F|nr:penicillin-binding protein [Bacteroides sp. 519]NDV57334.1 PASTA domain-containing protein [Bacteroides sp. 519]
MAADKKNIMARYFIVILFMGIIGVLVVVKAGKIMYGERQYWKEVADRFVRDNVIVKPNRGNILSSDGRLMASSLPEYRIYMDFQSGGKTKDTMLVNNLDTICKGLNKIFPDKTAKYFKDRLLEGRKAGSRNYPIYLGRISYIQYKQAKKLPVFNLSRFSGGFHEQVYNQRKKPFGSLATRTLGDVYGDTAQGARSGIELAFDTVLKGKDGIIRRQKVKNKFLNITEVPPIDGCDIVTTIDVGMQDICEKALVDKLIEINANEGLAVLMEVATGEVKAIVNMTKVGEGQYRETRNAAISNMTEPGSTFKTASIMVALEDGVITPDDIVDTGNGIKMMYKKPMRDHNWRRGGYQKLDVTQILMVSSNIGVSTLIDKHYHSNPDKFVDGLYKIGINRPLNLQIPGEGVPNIRRPKDGRWYNTALPWMSIGYETQIPPINMLTFYNAIANNGVMVKPKFVKGISKNGTLIETYPTEVINPSICSQKTLNTIKDMLAKVVSDGLGKPAGSKQFPVAGKTGTAQVAKGALGYTGGVMSYQVSFAGYFPADQPQYSCIVSIQKTGTASGGVMAGGVFKKIAERVYAKNLVLDMRAAIDSTSVVIPDVKVGELVQTKYVLDDLNVNTEAGFRFRGKKEIWGKSHIGTDAVVMEDKEFNKNIVPNVVGMGAKDAVYLLESKGLKVRLAGVGKVKKQSIANGSALRQGQTIMLQLD